MKLSNIRKWLFIVWLLILAVLAIYFFVGSNWFMREHGQELSDAIERIETTIARVQRGDDLELLKNDIESPALDNYLGAWENREECTECETRTIVLNVKATDLRLIAYWSGFAVVRGRTIIGQMRVDRFTDEITTPCHGSAHEMIYFLVERDGVWKLKNGKFLRFDTDTPVEEIRGRVCA